MKFSEHWLRTLVDPPLDSAALAHALTMAGLEVEEHASAAPKFTRVVVAKVHAVERHPTAQRLKVTPNRADCLSLAGIAREVGAITASPVTPPPPAKVASAAAASRGVRVEAPLACPRFCARVIEGIDAGAPTPSWMKQRLERSG